MKGYFELRGVARQMAFDPINKEFVLRTVSHSFVGQQMLLQKLLREDPDSEVLMQKNSTLKLTA